jgi:hypothetical protein
MNAVEERIHSPQRWQPNRGILTTSSKKRMKREILRSAGEMGL